MNQPKNSQVSQQLWSQKRSLAREYAFNFLFHIHLETAPVDIDEALIHFQATLTAQDEDDKEKERLKQLASSDLTYAHDLIRGVLKLKNALRIQIEPWLKNWTWEKLNTIDQAILLLATFEISQTDTPPKVVVNEAVELGKKYGTEKSAAFINGILDQLIHR